MTAVSLRLPDEVSKRLDKLAKRTGRTKTFYMIEAISEHWMSWRIYIWPNSA